MINSAVCTLHFHHPFKLITCLIKNIRNAVSTLRNTNIITVKLRICFISVKQVGNSFSCRNNISAVISGVMPPTGNIYFFICSVNGCHTCMAGRMTKITVCYHFSAALQIEHSYTIIKKICVDAVRYFKCIGIVKISALYIIFSGLRNRREISDFICFSGI